ncbi:MAG: phospho-N-acetylmuramoyl-pentapeptide-transferase [Candidatus Aminicenantes bacterium]|nr:phospho-N-acetylmuramoyl-pentapeptide-transferase [Candidatus Aminicenantes bacterium]
MLTLLLVPLKNISIFFNVFRYITVRTALAGITALLLGLLVGPVFIRWIKKRRLGQEIRSDGPQSHLSKKGTPSLGGILIIGATLVPTLLWGNLANPYVWLAMAGMLFFGLIGLWDDLLKIRRKNSRGLGVRQKFALQLLLAAAIGATLVLMGLEGRFDLRLSFPFIKQWIPFLGWLYLPWIMFILVGSSNSVNMADGLDGLAVGLAVVSAAALTALCYITGNAVWARYLDITFVRSAAELTVFAGAFAGACLGFLWYNCHPAQIFMGDAGSLSIGGTLGLLAILIKQEFLLVAVAGVFILESLSVLIQVSYFKISGGKRIFRMAPLHHHFELKGWAEEKVVVRFWVLGVVLALFSLATLKLR